MTALVPAYGPPGVLILHTSVDHLYESCPLLRRLCRGQEPQRLGGVFQLLQGGGELGQESLVDPLGSDICGWCRRVWRARNREETG